MNFLIFLVSIAAADSIGKISSLHLTFFPGAPPNIAPMCPIYEYNAGCNEAYAIDNNGTVMARIASQIVKKCDCETHKNQCDDAQYQYIRCSTPSNMVKYLNNLTLSINSNNDCAWFAIDGGGCNSGGHGVPSVRMEVVGFGGLGGCSFIENGVRNQMCWSSGVRLSWSWGIIVLMLVGLFR